MIELKLKHLLNLSRGLLSLGLCFGLFGLTGCTTPDRDRDEFEGQSVQHIYDTAQKALAREDFSSAVKHLEALSIHYPFGSYAQAADLQIIYAYYKAREWSSTLLAADRFIKLHPRHPHVDYAYYMKGKAKQEEGSSFLQRVLNLDPSKREPVHLREAFAEYKDMVERFPDSPYAADAANRMIFLRNVLAEHELYVAHYYSTRHATLAALNRAKRVISLFPETPARYEALRLMVRLYRELGFDDWAEQTQTILQSNPSS